MIYLITAAEVNGKRYDEGAYIECDRPTAKKLVNDGVAVWSDDFIIEEDYFEPMDINPITGFLEEE